MAKEYDSLNNLTLKKSNELVTAKYHSTLLESQVMNIAMTRIEYNALNKDAPLSANLYPGELKQLIGDPSNIYRTLKNMSDTMTGHSIVIEDGKGNFKAFAVVTNADYVDGVFTIKFNEAIKDHILNLEQRGKYTQFELSILTDFRRNSSMRLYELFKREMYKCKEVDSSIVIEYNLAELKFMLGLIDNDVDEVKASIKRNTSNGMINWDKIYDEVSGMVIEKKIIDKKTNQPVIKKEYVTKYNEWRDFQKDVLKVAQKELEEKSDIRFEYIPIRLNRKTNRVQFILYHNQPKNNEIIKKKSKIIEEGKYKQLEILTTQYPRLFGEFEGHHNLTKGDIEVLLQYSDYSEEVVRQAIYWVDEQPNVDNYMGYIIKRIQNPEWESSNIVLKNGIVIDNEKINAAKEINNNIKNNPEKYAKLTWEKITEKEDFNNFLDDLKEICNIDYDMLVIAYNYTEMVNFYMDWKKGTLE